MMVMLTLLTAMVTLSPAHATPLLGNDGADLLRVGAVFLRTNLHPDERRARLYATNYQQPGLLPVCTQVELLRYTPRKLVFVVVNTGRKYEYRWHDSAAEPFDQHLSRYFGTRCTTRDQLAKLSPLDRRGIRQGYAFPGMTRRAVELAMGYPPRHTTPHRDRDDWIYWKNRFDRLSVRFEGDLVADVVD